MIQVQDTFRPPVVESLTARRRLALIVTATLHGVVSGVSGIALGGLPRVGGIPVLRGPGAGPAIRSKLEAAILLLQEIAPGRLDRLRGHVLGIFLARQPRAHGHYSRITGLHPGSGALAGRRR
jgi:hypothetical protein